MSSAQAKHSYCHFITIAQVPVGCPWLKISWTSIKNKNLPLTISNHGPTRTSRGIKCISIINKPLICIMLCRSVRWLVTVFNSNGFCINDPTYHPNLVCHAPGIVYFPFFFLSFQLLGTNTSSRPMTRPKGRTSAIGKGTEKPGESRATTNHCKPLSIWRFVGWPTSCGNIISISRNFCVSSTTSSTSQEWITTHHWPSVTAPSSMGVPILGYEKQTNKQTNKQTENKQTNTWCRKKER